MKTKMIIQRTFNLLPLSLVIIMLFAFSEPRYMSVDQGISIDNPHIFRPILDSALLCSFSETWYGEYEIDFFYVAEQMPGPKISIYVIENILEEYIRFNAQELSYNDTIYFQCVVNCMGKAGDYQILKCPVELVNISCQVLNVLRIQFADWEPAMQKGQNVDLLTIIKVIVNKGQFEVQLLHASRYKDPENTL